MKEDVDPHQAPQWVHDYLDKHFEDVGAKFCKEGLKIYSGRKTQISKLSIPAKIE